MTASLNAYTIPSPGVAGLNTQDSPVNLDPSYALELNNAVFDQYGRIAARKGWTKLTEPELTNDPDIEQLHIFETSPTSYEIIYTATVSSNKKIYSARSTDSPAYSGSTNVTGTATPTSNVWQFCNFLGRGSGAAGSTRMCIGAQTGEQLIWMAAGGTFATITAASGTVPTSNCVLSAWGRVWATTTANGTTIAYSALLDETHWSTGAGTIDTGSRWPNSDDYIVALAAYNNYLIVFGKYSILIYDSPENVSNLALVDTIAGVGCIARDSIQDIGTDLLFLSATGIRSLQRTIETNSLPLQEVTPKVRDYLNFFTNNLATDYSTVRSCYNQRDGFYLLVINPYVFYFDCKNINPEIGLRCSVWIMPTLHSVAYSRAEIMYMGHEGAIGTYSGYLDNTDTYTFSYLSPWIDLSTAEGTGAFRYKIPKKLIFTTIGGSNYTVSARWTFDFSRSYNTATATIPNSSTTQAEWGTTTNQAEWGLAEWGEVGVGIKDLKYNTNKYGQYLQVGFTVPINNKSLSFQRITIVFKEGRVAR